ncbi:MAG: sel1 repeat family protein [Rudaea sp.]|uniref:sel1 repeat family protein n=1 Tax=unclassified Rudaea TaxID=2627037 RepID=UPI001AD3442F|nr:MULTISPECIES: sel1 repeat family protein [unclassified Rudaea]MBN8886922.1 sel1 repeat family protein [Rudaea sp.]
MRASFGKRMLCAALAAAMLAPVAHADGDPLDDPGVQKTLRAMANASTWYHPDIFGMTVGMRRYAHKDYAGALKYFEIGSYYADKLSQLSTGLMYMNGEGVKKDPVTAYAWLDLAAERDYPEFVSTRDNLKAELSPEQLAQATEMRKKLSERYGDAVAKPRMAQQLRQGQTEITGSRTGFDSGANHIATNTHCGPALVIGGRTIPQVGCGSVDMYARDNWDPDKYFAGRDREWKATVTVGSLEEQGKPAGQSTASPPATTKPVDAPAAGGVQKQ